MNVLYLSKENYATEVAKQYLLAAFGHCSVKCFSSNEKYSSFPNELLNQEGEVLISFLCPWVLPKLLLNKFKLSLNFHPGPPSYPGTGGYNFALYDNVAEYGVTCHHISDKVDSGEIVKAIFFPINKFDTVLTLRDKSWTCLLQLFFEIVDTVSRGRVLPKSDLKWSRDALKKTEFDKLREIKITMSEEEIAKRVRATSYPGMPGAFIDVYGNRFNFGSS